MEQAFRELLRGHAPLVALVGGAVDWGVRPQGRPLPGVVLQLVSAVPGMTFGGADGWTRARVQIDAWAATFKAAGTIADTIGGPGGLLVGFRGDQNGVRFRTFVIGRRSDSEGGEGDQARIEHRASLDVLVWHRTL